MIKTFSPSFRAQRQRLFVCICQGMHHALEIKEILFNIFGHYDRYANLAALARTLLVLYTHRELRLEPRVSL